MLCIIVVHYARNLKKNVFRFSHLLIKGYSPLPIEVHYYIVPSNNLPLEVISRVILGIFTPDN